MHRSCNACGRNLDDVFIKAIDDYNNKLSMAYNPFKPNSKRYYDYNMRLESVVPITSSFNSVINNIADGVGISNNTIDNDITIRSNSKLTNKKRLLLV